MTSFLEVGIIKNIIHTWNKRQEKYFNKKVAAIFFPILSQCSELMCMIGPLISPHLNPNNHSGPYSSSRFVTEKY